MPRVIVISSSNTMFARRQNTRNNVPPRSSRVTAGVVGVSGVEFVNQHKAHGVARRGVPRARRASAPSSSTAERRTFVEAAQTPTSTPQARALATLVATLSWLTAAMRPTASGAHSSPTARRRCRPRRAPSRQTNNDTRHKSTSRLSAAHDKHALAVTHPTQHAIEFVVDRLRARWQESTQANVQSPKMFTAANTTRTNIILQQCFSLSNS